MNSDKAPNGLTAAPNHAIRKVPASFGSRAGLAKATSASAKADTRNAQAVDLMVIWAARRRVIVRFMCSIWSMMLVMRRQQRCKPIVGEWPGLRVGKLGREQGLAATVSPQFSLIPQDP